MMIPASKGRGKIFHVKFEVSEEINILSCFKWAEGINSTINGGIYQNLTSRCRKGGLFNRSNHLPHVKTADLLHLERSPIQISVLPSEFIRVRIVLEVLFRI